MKSSALFLIASALVVTACTSEVASSSQSAIGPTGRSSAPPIGSSACSWSDLYRRCLPPVDPSIEPISLSRPRPEAAAVLQRCLNDRDGIEVVAGGRIPHAREAWEYVPVPRNQGGIQSDEPMWVLQLRGTFIFPTPSGAAPDAGTVRNPVCFARNGESGYIDVSETDASAVTKSLPPPTP
jgi:hypothetical protein